MARLIGQCGSALVGLAMGERIGTRRRARRREVKPHASFGWGLRKQAMKEGMRRASEIWSDNMRISWSALRCAGVGVCVGRAAASETDRAVRRRGTGPPRQNATGCGRPESLAATHSALTFPRQHKFGECLEFACQEVARLDGILCVDDKHARRESRLIPNGPEVLCG